MTHTSDFLIIGGGIVGLTIAGELNARHPNARITILEKESAIATHSSGRNSGVMHAGFYYSADSLKAKFCRDGSRAMQEYCREHKLPLSNNQKLVVAQNGNEVQGLHELKKRGDKNGVEVHLIDEKEAQKIEPNVRTTELALFSPHTATVDPAAICAHLRDALLQKNVTIFTDTRYVKRITRTKILTTQGEFEAGKIINCAGLYADKIAHDFGFGHDYTIMPFKGVYLKYTGNTPPLKVNIYPVPNLKNPFLGVHFTVTANGTVKIGPTAIPALWREHYQGLSRFKLEELAPIVFWQSKLFLTNAFNFRSLAFEEIRKYQKSHLLKLASGLVKNFTPHHEPDAWHWSAPGIRAQLLHTKNLSLVQDFVVEGDSDSTHVLNAVSPAFTCSLPFAGWVVETHL